MSRLSNDRDSNDRKQAGDAEALSFEQSQAELEKLIGQIESGQLGLEESIAAYERGQQLLNRARGILSKAEQTFTDLTAKANQAANQASGEGA
jgi:exodeoxyribonuclease VII small subunit